jgi:hypothetical protein
MSVTTEGAAAFSPPGAMDCEILVLPAAGGWSVEFSPNQSPWMFLSGAKAEEGARTLAKRIADSGRDATVLIHDRRQMLVGSWRYFGSDPGDLAPLAELPRLR